MSRTYRLSVELPAGMAEMVKRKVAAGDYASESDVIREGLHALQDRDETLERWLREEVAPAYDAMQADPSTLIDAETVFADLRARHAKTVP